jgi:DNA-directed RNA polymerase subunit M/transcription elongation factor TFIIS
MGSTMIPFTDNYQDRSSEYGYQFEFYCERCGNGYSSSFQKSAAGMGGGLLRAASGFLSGSLGRASHSVDQMAEMARGSGRDAALKKAVEEMRPLFHQCHRCGNWVCRDVCWNTATGLCTSCSPKLDQELGALQSEERLRQIQEKLTTVNLVKDINLGEQVVARCPSCHAETQGSKFCPECGTSLSPKLTCRSCGHEAKAGTKFCPECGTSLAT